MQHERAIRNNNYQRHGATSSVLPSICKCTFSCAPLRIDVNVLLLLHGYPLACALSAVCYRLSARLWRMLTACSAASAMRSSAGWRSFMCVHCLTTVLLRVLAYAMQSAVLTVQTNCACVAVRCWRLQRPCNGPATPLQRPCNGPTTALQRPYNGPAMAPQRPCNDATALQRPCNGAAMALQRPATGRTATVDGHCLAGRATGAATRCGRGPRLCAPCGDCRTQGKVRSCDKCHQAVFSMGICSQCLKAGNAAVRQEKSSMALVL